MDRCSFPDIAARLAGMSAPFDLAVVVDDDPDIALAARLALRDLFETVSTLPSPDGLAALLKKESPDVILLDLNFERGASRAASAMSGSSSTTTAKSKGALIPANLAVMSGNEQ